MQNPVGAEFNYQHHAHGDDRLLGRALQPDAQAKFVHTVSAGYVTGAMFVLAISSWYLLKGRDIEFAKRRFRVAAAFGLASALSVIVLGDESGYTVGEAQQTKLAAIEAMWETEPAPAGFNAVRRHQRSGRRSNDWEIEDSLGDGPDRHALAQQADPRHQRDQGRRTASASSRGIVAVTALEALRKQPRRRRGQGSRSRRTRPISASACC